LRALRYAAEYSVRSNGVVDRPGPRTFFSFFRGGGGRGIWAARWIGRTRRIVRWHGVAVQVRFRRGVLVPRRVDRRPPRRCQAAAAVKL
jgi:hypothetical protein